RCVQGMSGGGATLGDGSKAGTASASMPNKTELVVHLVWATWNRQPVITGDVEAVVFRAIDAKCIDLRCPPHAIGGTPDHVHVLCRVDPSISIVRLAAQVKGFSSWATRRHLGPAADFRWQAGYGAFTV